MVKVLRGDFTEGPKEEEVHNAYVSTSQRSLRLALGATIATTIIAGITVLGFFWNISNDVLNELKAEHQRLSDKIDATAEKSLASDNRILDKIDALMEKSQAGDERLTDRIDMVILKAISEKSSK